MTMKDAVRMVGELMAVAARTAPKAGRMTTSSGRTASRPGPVPSASRRKAIPISRRRRSTASRAARELDRPTALVQQRLLGAMREMEQGASFILIDCANRRGGHLSVVAASARHLAVIVAAQGARVVVNDRGGDVYGQGASTSPADAVAAEIRAAGGQAVTSHHDVADWDQDGVPDALDNCRLVVNPEQADFEGLLAELDEMLKLLMSGHSVACITRLRMGLGDHQRHRHAPLEGQAHRAGQQHAHLGEERVVVGAGQAECCILSRRCQVGDGVSSSMKSTFRPRQKLFQTHTASPQLWPQRWSVSLTITLRPSAAGGSFW